jgi:osmotically-inducible protein OsmY
MNGGPFLAYEAAGDYPIHIIVKNGHVTLLGIVDSESDKTIAGMRAREVPGSFSVENQLVVRKQTEAGKR